MSRYRQRGPLHSSAILARPWACGFDPGLALPSLVSGSFVRSLSVALVSRLCRLGLTVPPLVCPAQLHIRCGSVPVICSCLLSCLLSVPSAGSSYACALLGESHWNLEHAVSRRSFTRLDDRNSYYVIVLCCMYFYAGSTILYDKQRNKNTHNSLRGV